MLTDAAGTPRKFRIPDGRFRLTIPSAHSTQASRYYLNAIMLRAQPARLAPQLRWARSLVGQLLLAWTCAGCLLKESSTLHGPWQPASNQGNPQLISPTGARSFYRLRQR